MTMEQRQALANAIKGLDIAINALSSTPATDKAFQIEIRQLEDMIIGIEIIHDDNEELSDV